MNNKEIIDFFNMKAPLWDKTTVRREEIISEILKNSEICEGDTLLDVACGTGVLFSDYRSLGVSHITAIDISPEMAKIAKEKLKDGRLICGDASEYDFSCCFDKIMIYDAFPHFPEPQKLIAHLSGYLAKDGRLTVAHSMSRKQLIELHCSCAPKVSRELIEARALAELMSEYLYVDKIISDDNMYLVSGKKK